MERSKRKTAGDLFFNFISMGITAICGAAFSFIISVSYNEGVLGRFNTVYAYYIVLSQLCVCGLHMAVTKYAAEYIFEKESISALLAEGLMMSFTSSLMVSMTGCLAVNILLKEFLGDSLVRSFNAIWLALIFFSLNKVFLGWLNGCSMLKAYAFFQALRNVLIAFSLIFFSWQKMPGELLSYSFLVSEIMLFFLEMVYSLWKRILVPKYSCRFVRQLLDFGIRILPSNAVLELNTKIDVICLAFILHDESLVGIYSFAAMFGEGFYQIFVVIKKVVNPKITANYISGKLQNYILYVKKIFVRYIYLGGMAILIITLAAYCLIIKLIGQTAYSKGVYPLAILCICTLFNSKAIILGDILAQTGNPLEESVSNIFTALCNGILNICLIGRYGIIGASAATGLSYFIYCMIQRYYVNKKLNILI